MAWLFLCFNSMCLNIFYRPFLPVWAYSYTSISQQEGSPPPLPREDTRLAPLPPWRYYGDGKEVRVAHAGLGSCGISRAAARRELQHRLPLAVQRAARLDRVVHESRRRRVAALDLVRQGDVSVCAR